MTLDGDKIVAIVAMLGSLILVLRRYFRMKR
jgi:hypothetical protein